MDAPHDGARRASLLSIVVTFGRISATSFGGGSMGAIRREVVRGRRWLGEDEYLELLSIAQLLPGANPVNVAVLVGSRLRGILGAAAALSAVVFPGFVILMIVAALALSAHSPVMNGALRACASVAVGLTLANAIEMTLPRRRNLTELLIVAMVAVSVLVLHASLALTLAMFIPVALVLTRHEAA